MNNLKRPEDKKIKTVLLAELYKVRQGMEKVYNLFATIETFPSGTAVCESAFSTPQRINMLTKRLNNLTFLAFEHKQLKSLDLDAILIRFNALIDRKMQLFKK